MIADGWGRNARIQITKKTLNNSKVTLSLLLVVMLLASIGVMDVDMLGDGTSSDHSSSQPQNIQHQSDRELQDELGDLLSIYETCSETCARNYWTLLRSIAQKCANATYLKHLALLQQLHALYSNASRHCKCSSTQAAYPLVDATYSAAASLIEGAVPQPNHEIAILRVHVHNLEIHFGAS